MSIAKIINQQINAIDRMAFFAWGVKEKFDTGTSLKFKSTGMTAWKGWVEVKYNEGTDLYDIDFYRVRAGTIKMDKQVTDVYAEDLVSNIDAQVR